MSGSKKPQPAGKRVLKEYGSWSFGGRVFIFALFCSLLWHLFWFYSIQIKVSVPSKHRRPHLKTVVLSPVLSDAIFRTLVDTRVSSSKTVYRGAEDFSPPINLPVKTMEKRAPGDIVSVPFGRNVITSLRDLISGKKFSQDSDFIPKIAAPSKAAYYEWDTEFAKKAVIFEPEEPELNSQSLKRINRDVFEATVTLAGSGRVEKAETTASSGDLSVDLICTNYLRQWRFGPASADNIAPTQGHVKIYLKTLGETS